MNNPYKFNISSRSTHKIFIDNIGSNKIVLDVGCNDGYIGASSDKTNTFYGLDYLKESIEKAKKTYKDAIVYDLNKESKLPWNVKFDTILFGDVLEHLVYPEKVLRNFTKNYLKNNGTVIVALPNVANWQIRLKLLFGNFNSTETGILDKTHLHLYTFNTARKLIKSAGLHIQSEIGGSSMFGGIIKILPFTRGLLSYNIVLVSKR